MGEFEILDFGIYIIENGGKILLEIYGRRLNNVESLDEVRDYEL